QGNLIGTQKNGKDPLGNGQTGVYINGGSENTIGGADPSQLNVISANKAWGVQIEKDLNPSVENQVYRAGIGTDKDGNKVKGLENIKGHVSDMGTRTKLSFNTMGGNGGPMWLAGTDTIVDSNYIVANEGGGIVVAGSGMVIENNHIGLDEAGDSMGNQGDGIVVQDSDNEITNNVIAYNSGVGVDILSGTGN